MSERDFAEKESIKRALYEAVAMGWMTVSDRDGEAIFTLTEEGKRHVDEMQTEEASQS